MAEPTHAQVPDVIGFLLDSARAYAATYGLLLTTGDPDAVGLDGSQYAVIAQEPPPGSSVPRWSWLRVEVERLGGGGPDGVREPRRPLPGLPSVAAESHPEDD